MTILKARTNETPSVVPLPGQLVRGEIAFNLPDRALYTKDHNDDVVEIANRYRYPSNAAMIADVLIPVGTIVRRQSFYDGWQSSSDGPLGGLSFQLRSSGTRPAEDGGTIVHQGTGTRYFQSVRTEDEEYTPEQFGMPNAGGDLTPYLEAAMISADGKPIRLRTGHDYTMNGAISYTGSVHLIGHKTTVVNLTVEDSLIVVGSYRQQGILFDGGSIVGTAVNVDGSGLGVMHIDSGFIFQNFKSALGTLVVQSTDMLTSEINNGSFKNILAVANNVTGDTVGVSRCINFSASHELAYAHDLVIDTVHSVDGLDNPIYEDADGIATATRNADNSSPKITVVERVKFINCGKRAVKFNATINVDQCVVRDCTVDSPWLGTADGSGAIDNGMASVASCQCGHLFLQNVKSGGGAIGKFVSAAGNCSKVTVRDCEHHPEEHSHIQGGQTTFVSAVTNVKCDILVDNCHTTGARRSFYISDLGGAHEGTLKVIGGSIQSQISGAQIFSGLYSLDFQGIRFTKWGSSATTRALIFSGEFVKRVRFINNDVDSAIQDGVYFTVEPSDPNHTIIITGNTLPVTRDKVRWQGTQSPAANTLIENNF